MAQHLLIIVWKESIVRNHYFGKRFVGECTEPEVPVRPLHSFGEIGTDANVCNGLTRFLELGN